LLAQDYYSGAIDGSVGPALRSALRKFQKDRGLDVSGTITPGTLDALMISSQWGQIPARTPAAMV